MEHQEIAQLIKNDRQKIAEEALRLQLELMPEMAKRYSAYQMEKTIQDMKYHVQFLETALLADSPPLFTNYLLWLKELLESLGVPLRDLNMSVVCLGKCLNARYPDSYGKTMDWIIREGLEHLNMETLPSKTFFTEELPYSGLAAKYLEFLLKGERFQASELIQNEMKQGAPIKEIYLQVFQNTQYEIGRLWQTGKISVAQEHYCTAASQFVMAQLYPYIFKTANQGMTVVAGCVGNELHEIGIRMIADFMELSGYNTYYLGANTPAESIIATLAAHKPSVLAVSATMTFHVVEVADLIQKVREAKECDDVIIMAGGYPFNVDKDLWKTVGADCYARNAEEAVGVLLALTNEVGN
jgi:methanogenic corrinoid protein MtbC1